MRFLWPWHKEQYSAPTEIVELREVSNELRDIAGTLRETAASLSEQVNRLASEETCAPRS